MGVRGELFSTKVALQNRTYFFNVKENRLGDLYLNIVESKNRDEGGFERQSVILFADDLQDFLQGFDESLRALERAAREKRRGSPGKSTRPPGRDKWQDDGAAGTNESQRSAKSVAHGKKFSVRRTADEKPFKSYEGRGSPRFKDRDQRNRDWDQRPKDNFFKDKGDFSPRKKRMVVKKKQTK
jgi:hypothetical protein